MNTLFDTVLATVRREQLLSDTETVIVGFSGGADSVSLLHALFTNKEKLSLANVVAVHINHQLRGEESNRDHRFAEEFCQQHDIPFFSFSYDVAALAREHRKGVEELGRELRYRCFDEIASQYPKSRVATAHTADDNAETVLLHLCRGCGIHGLMGIPPIRGNIIRPLIDCTRDEVERYCEQHQLFFVTDSTNSDVQYSRNRIRHCVMPSLRSINPSVDTAIGRLIRQSRETDRFLSRLVDDCWNRVVTEEAHRYKRKPLLEVDPVLQRLLLERMLRQASLPIDEHHLLCMQQSLFNGSKTSLPREYVFAASGEICSVFRQKKGEESCLQEQDLPLDGVLVFGEERHRVLVLTRQEYEQKLNICHSLFKNACDYDMITGVPVVRGRREGDAFHPAGRSCGKSLKKLFNEAALPPDKRDAIPLVCDDDGIVLVVGFGCDERVRITKSTTRVLLVEKTEE